MVGVCGCVGRGPRGISQCQEQTAPGYNHLHTAAAYDTLLYIIDQAPSTTAPTAMIEASESIML